MLSRRIRSSSSAAFAAFFASAFFWFFFWIFVAVGSGSAVELGSTAPPDENEIDTGSVIQVSFCPSVPTEVNNSSKLPLRTLLLSRHYTPSVILLLLLHRRSVLGVAAR